jgi:hypothetical protein
MKTNKNKPLVLSLEIEGYQEDEIVAASLKASFKSVKSGNDIFSFQEDKDAMLKAFKEVYHYYTGKLLK